MGFLASTGSAVLLFFLVCGMSATVEIKQLRKQMTNVTALCIGVGMQFIILPFVGFLVVKLLQLPAAVGITLLVVTSSPGGSYSNWWCSLFNAELSLSVTMTALSTLLSTIMLPTNLILYTRWTYSSDVVQSLDWGALFLSLVVVLGGIATGLYTSARSRRNPLVHRRMNLLGNLAGVCLVTLSLAVNSSNQQSSIWNQDASFYIAVTLPAVIGLSLAVYWTSQMKLEKPERVAVSVEACYQNTGIATSVAITMFAGNRDQLSTAIGVPLFYGLVEAVMLACFCLICWKLGWTKAPPDENLCVVLFTSYEVEEMDRREQQEAIEIVLDKDGCAPNDLIFAQTGEDGAYIVDTETLEKLNHDSDDDPTESSLDLTHFHPDNPWLPRRARYNRTSPSLSTSRTSRDNSGNSRSRMDAASMILELEDNQLFGSAANRFGRTFATFRARVVGYRQTEVDEATSTLENATRERTDYR